MVLWWVGNLTLINHSSRGCKQSASLGAEKPPFKQPPIQFLVAVHFKRGIQRAVGGTTGEFLPGGGGPERQYFFPQEAAAMSA